MKGKLKNLRLAVVAGLCTAMLGFSQVSSTAQQQQKPDSIHPGEVNYIEGHVTLNGTALESSSLRSTVLQPGGDLTTGQGYAEILLSPGAFLRVGNNSEILLVNSGLVNSTINVIHGSALLEAADVVKGASISVQVGSATAHVTDKGLYSFDANNQSVKVFDGKLNVSAAADKETTLKKGDQVLLTSDQPLKKRDFKTKAAEEDPLYVWSKVRSHDEAEASINIADQVANSGGWYGPGWYWDPAWSFYAFAPGYGYLGGPFGWNYYSPAFIYGGYWGGGDWGRGYYGRYPGRYYGANRGFRGGRGYAHSFGGVRGMSGMHAGGGSFHGGAGGFHGGGGGHR